jgi:hypothetical protein
MLVLLTGREDVQVRDRGRRAAQIRAGPVGVEALQQRLEAARLARASIQTDVLNAVSSALHEQKSLLHLAQQLRARCELPDKHHLDLTLYPRPPTGTKREVCASVCYTCL